MTQPKCEGKKNKKNKTWYLVGDRIKRQNQEADKLTTFGTMANIFLVSGRGIGILSARSSYMIGFVALVVKSIAVVGGINTDDRFASRSESRSKFRERLSLVLLLSSSMNISFRIAQSIVLRRFARDLAILVVPRVCFVAISLQKLTRDFNKFLFCFVLDLICRLVHNSIKWEVPRTTRDWTCSSQMTSHFLSSSRKMGQTYLYGLSHLAWPLSP